MGTLLPESRFSFTVARNVKTVLYPNIEALCIDTHKRSSYRAFSLIDTEMIEKTQFYFAYVVIAYKVTKPSSFLLPSPNQPSKKPSPTQPNQKPNPDQTSSKPSHTQPSIKPAPTYPNLKASLAQPITKPSPDQPNQTPRPNQLKT